jgi:hypothetical protein
VVVVFPASIWAIIPILRHFSNAIFRFKAGISAQCPVMRNQRSRVNASCITIY